MDTLHRHTVWQDDLVYLRRGECFEVKHFLLSIGTNRAQSSIIGGEKAVESTFILKFDSFGNRRWRNNKIEGEGFGRGWSMWHAVAVAAIAVDVGAERDGTNKAAKRSRHWRYCLMLQVKNLSRVYSYLPYFLGQALHHPLSFNLLEILFSKIRYISNIYCPRSPLSSAVG